MVRHGTLSGYLVREVVRLRSWFTVVHLELSGWDLVSRRAVELCERTVNRMLTTQADTNRSLALSITMPSFGTSFLLSWHYVILQSHLVLVLLVAAMPVNILIANLTSDNFETTSLSQKQCSLSASTSFIDCTY